MKEDEKDGVEVKDDDEDKEDYKEEKEENAEEEDKKEDEGRLETALNCFQQRIIQDGMWEK